MNELKQPAPMYHYPETNGSSGQPPSNVNFTPQANGMDLGPRSDSGMYRPQSCYPAMYPNMNSYISPNQQYPGQMYSNSAAYTTATPPPPNHLFSHMNQRQENMYSPPMSGYNPQASNNDTIHISMGQENHDANSMHRPGYFSSLMAGTLPPPAPIPVNNETTLSPPPPPMRHPVPYHGGYPGPVHPLSSRASPISPMMIRSPGSVHSSNHSVPSSSPGPIPSPSIKSPKSVGSSGMKSPTGLCSPGHQHQMMSPPLSNNGSNHAMPSTNNRSGPLHSPSSVTSVTQHSTISQHLQSKSPLQSLERLSMLPNKKVVNPRSVVKREKHCDSVPKVCADGRNCSTDSEPSSLSQDGIKPDPSQSLRMHAGSELSEVQNVAQTILPSISIKSEIISPKHSPRRRSSESAKSSRQRFPSGIKCEDNSGDKREETSRNRRKDVHIMRVCQDDTDGDMADSNQSICDGDGSPTKKKRGRPHGSKTINRTPKEVLKAKRLMKQGLLTNEEVVHVKELMSSSRNNNINTTTQPCQSNKTSKNDKSPDNTNSTKAVLLRKKETFVAPHIRVTGPKANPVVCTIINNTQQHSLSDHKGNKKRRIVHNLNQQVEDDRTVAALAAGSMYTPTVWVCCFCGHGSTYRYLGDLFGPYYIDNFKTLDKSPVLKATKERKRSKSKEFSDNGQTPKWKRQRSSSGSSSKHDNDLEVWVHEICISWAHGVCLSGGRVHGLSEATKQAAETVCSSCKRHGATIGCLKKGCNQKYHHPCAEDRDCHLLEENFSLFCPKHKDKRLTYSAGSVKCLPAPP